MNKEIKKLERKLKKSQLETEKWKGKYNLLKTEIDTFVDVLKEL